MYTKILSALIVAGLGAFGIYEAKSPNEKSITIVSIPLSDYLGITKCVDGKPMVFLSDTLTGNNLTGTLIHEMRHVGQHDAYRTCDEMDSLYTVNGYVRITLEADAYCAELKTMHRLGIDPPMGRVDAEMRVMSLLHELDTTVSTSYVSGEMARFCGGT